MVEWVKRHPIATYFLFFLAIGLVAQIIHGRSSFGEKYRECVEASKIGVADRARCATISK
ncbi:hypothetical protein FJ976_17255 [Mesorhizobium sp. B1-1-9]|uniref:hypothetical protein n=1 Tax=Mesorhizobium sp. B1-1-9 TaxID=2589975 RepID=UPI00112DF3B7|nr:hypothetical protein [Mesorhizobium sp. B1-1-9]TPN49478.1 hypothetical protein FJ976_17255 [Mesorhizobium sp. B1-1-9]